MEKFLEFINFPLFSVYENTYSVGQILFVPIVLVIGHFLIGMTRRKVLNRLREQAHDRDFILLLERVLLIGSYILLVLFALSLLKIPLTAFAFVSGAVAIGVGFGAQNIFNNFISGWILMWERPIRLGDFLEIGDVKGTVETINTRSTRIRRVDGVHLLVPNSQLLENTVVNWTLIDKLARAIVRVGVAYGSDVRLVEKLIYEAVNSHSDIIDEPKPIVVFEDFGDSALIFDTYFWINAFGEKDLRMIRSDIRFKLDELFAENNIVIAFPQTDVHMDGKLTLVTEQSSAPASMVEKKTD